jgi:RHS repeat-associated protein
MRGPFYQTLRFARLLLLVVVLLLIAASTAQAMRYLTPVSTNSFGYNGAGDLRSITDGRGRVVSWNYNKYGLVTNKVDGAMAVAFIYGYNPNGQVTNRWTPANGNAAYYHDPVGNLTNIAYGGTPSISFAYDAMRRLTNMVDALGETHFVYDAAGELLSAGGLWPGDTITYSYSNRLRSSMVLSHWTNSYAYDPAGRLANLTSAAGSFSYGYDQQRFLRVARLSLPNGAYITNTFDSVARLAGTYLKNSANGVLDGYSYRYDLLGQRTNIGRDFGLMSSTVTAGFDAVGQLISWAASEPNGTPRLNEQLGYAYDAAGNLQQRTNNAFVQTFSVDGANALTNISRDGPLTVSGNTPAPASSVTVNGNPGVLYGDFTFASTSGFALADGPNTFTNIAINYYGTASATNVLTVDLPASIQLQFDANGNLTNDGARSLSYDSENQLTNIMASGQWRTDLLYDGLGRRRIVRDYAWQSGAWVLTNEVRYIYDGMLPIQERDSNNVTQVTYTRGLDLSTTLGKLGGIGGLLARRDDHGTTFYHADGNGNVTALVDHDQYVLARYLYDPFGRLTSKWGALADVNSMQFSSMPLHALSGLSFYPYRDYSPSLQRWLSRDPISEAGGINLYGFVGNNSINRMDPFGLWRWDRGYIQWGIGSLLGPLIGFGSSEITAAAWGGFAEGWSKGGQGVINDLTGGLNNSTDGYWYGSFDKVDKEAFGTGISCDSAFEFGSDAGRAAESTLLMAGFLQSAEIGAVELGGLQGATLNAGRAEAVAAEGIGAAEAVAAETGANSALQGARLGEHLRQLETYGQAGFKELENGSIRYYGNLKPASTPGEMSGARLVREWTPETGAKRTWIEILDQSGTVRSVRPETGGPKVHYIFDANGNYIGTR